MAGVLTGQCFSMAFVSRSLMTVKRNRYGPTWKSWKIGSPDGSGTVSLRVKKPEVYLTGERTQIMSKKRKYSTGDEFLDNLLWAEKMLTFKWYQRISGEVPWKPGEREQINALAADLASQINVRMAKREIGELADALERQ